MRKAGAWTFATLGALTVASVVAAQDLAPANADPACAYHVEGRVLLTGDRPGADLAIERVSDASGRNPYSTVFNTRTDANGHFQFSFAGIGIRTGSVWYLLVRRPQCPSTVATVHLHEDRVPPSNQVGDVATNVVVRVPHCHRDPPAPAAHTAHAHAATYPPVTSNIAVYYEGRMHNVDIEAVARPTRARVVPFLTLWRNAIGGTMPTPMYFDPIGSDGFRPAMREDCRRVLTERDFADVTIDVATHDLNFPSTSTLAHCYHVHRVAAVDVYASP